MARRRALVEPGRLVLGLGLAMACGSRNEPPVQGTETGSTSVANTTQPAATVSTSPTTAPEPTTTASTTAISTVDDTTASPGTDTTTGPAACTKHVVLMGYWPPTNEMLRPWSDNLAQNPGGWIGQDWEGYGYDVYAFFPEFPPDGDPTNDAIGDDGAVGSPRYDLRVDYQATSADFWRIVDTYRPVILVTTSRGGAIGWEVEAIEGGHGMGNAGDPSLDWASDQHGTVQFPTEASIEPPSWDAITTYRQANTLPTRLPAAAIVEATSALGLTTVEIDERGTSGNFLSGFLGLHGLYYAQQAPYEVVAAGHIHVGYGLPVADASALIEATLHAVLQAHPADQVACP